MLMLASKLINLKTAVEAVFRINLKTAVGPCKKAQSFDPEPLDAGVAFTFWECSTPASRGSGSKSCTFLHDPTAVFRLMGRCRSIKGSVPLPSEGITKLALEAKFDDFCEGPVSAKIDILDLE